MPVSDRYILNKIKSRTHMEGNCRVWNGSWCGYPLIAVQGKAIRLHRKLYEIVHGPIPEGMIVRHKCDNKRCLNINHLELGTHRDNRRDRAIRQHT